mgnify:CR=1 FL=1
MLDIVLSLLHRRKTEKMNIALDSIDKMLVENKAVITKASTASEIKTLKNYNRVISMNYVFPAMLKNQK